MTSLFGNFAIKQTLGGATFPGVLPLERLATGAVSIAPPKPNATPTIGDVTSISKGEASLEEQLFDAKAAAKIVTSRVAMRIGHEWRRRLYRQLDSLLDIEEWLAEDTPLRTESFTTFLRLMFVLKPEVKPGLGVTATGELLAMWDSSDASRLTLECLPHDVIRWVLSVPIEDRRESAAGETTIQRARDVLAAYEPNRWFVQRVPA